MLRLALELLEDRQNNACNCHCGGKDIMYLYTGNMNNEKQLLMEWIILLEDIHITVGLKSIDMYDCNKHLDNVN